ncbi:DUF6075 family protein (plasmid) [Enterocloster clostridioformis]
MIFINDEHERFFKNNIEKGYENDPYRQVLFYCLGIDPSTREHIGRIYDFNENSIVLECINEGWQTTGSLAVTRLAFNLYNNGTPTVALYEEDQEQQLAECRRYSVEDIFSVTRAYTDYFIQAIKMRYPEIKNDIV